MIIDAHAHIFPDKIAVKASTAVGTFYGLPMNFDGTVNTLLAEGEAAGVDKFLVHSVATKPEQVESITHFIASSVKAHPDKFIGFAAMHQDYPEKAKFIDDVIAMGLKGVKIHPDFQEVSLSDKRLWELFEIIEGRLPILIHTGDKRYKWSSPSYVKDILNRFPKLQVIGAHFGGWSEWDTAEKLLSGQRMYVDTSSSFYSMTPERAYEIIKAFGADRVLFGSDYPMWSPKEELEFFNKIPLSDREREMILHENFEKLLNL
ncbi:MAG: amidohydrolase family protein [Ruminococcus sp.]|jgi:predicted TIM-barrel fold metal-dependent hydrolase|nr:amidohydrolase family protein [Ruminococcus sp.]